MPACCPAPLLAALWIGGDRWQQAASKYRISVIQSSKINERRKDAYVRSVGGRSNRWLNGASEGCSTCVDARQVSTVTIINRATNTNMLMKIVH